MSGVTVAVVGGTGVAAQLGKKGTVSDLTLFDSTHDGHHATIVEPTHFPEKFAPLLAALGMANRAVLVVEALDRSVAEAIATLELVDLPTLVLRGPAVGEDELGRALKGGRLASVPQLALDLPQLREMIDGWTVPPNPGTVLVPIDHAFPVKGVGAVALGVVRRGTLKSHESLRLWPTERSVEVRSIQVHDVDVKEAATGERVGVALKGVDTDELSRGQILAPAESLLAGRELTAERLQRCRYYRGEWGTGSQMTIAIGTQTAPVSVGPITDLAVSLTTDRPVVYSAGAAAYLIDLNATGGPRIAGRLTLETPAAPGGGPA